MGSSEESGRGGVIERLLSNASDLAGKSECAEELNTETWEHFILAGYVHMSAVQFS